MHYIRLVDRQTYPFEAFNLTRDAFSLIKIPFESGKTN